MGGALPVAKTDEERATAQARRRGARARSAPLSRALEDDGLGCAPTPRSTCRLSLCSPSMERTGAAIDVAHLDADRRAHARATKSRALRARIYRACRRGVQRGLAQAARPHPVRGAWACRRAQEDAARVFHRREGAQGARRGSRAACARAALPRAGEDQVRPTSTPCRRMRATDGRVHSIIQRDGRRPTGRLSSSRPELAEHPRAHRISAAIFESASCRSSEDSHVSLG